MAKKLCLIGLSLCIVWAFDRPPALYAQDEGEPAMKTLALFSIGGGAGGAGFGAMIWLLDPLNPNADLTHSIFTGFAVGAIVGAIFGGMQLQKQAVYPYQPGLPAPSEFDGAMPLGLNGHISPAMPKLRKERSQVITLASLHLSF